MLVNIAIVGAGRGGLALARVLHVHGIESVVYERDSSRNACGQGGMLDIHSGQQALREAGLFDRFQAIARVAGQDMRLLEPDGTLLLQEDTPADAPLDRPEVDRADLRDLLLDSLPERRSRSTSGRCSTAPARPPGSPLRSRKCSRAPDAARRMLAFFQLSGA